MDRRFFLFYKVVILSAAARRPSDTFAMNPTPGLFKRGAAVLSAWRWVDALKLARPEGR
jgi:hypothetical protein